MLTVGAEGERLIVDKNILCERSLFFRTAFQGHFKETLTQVMMLREELPRIVKIVILWLYAGSPHDCLPEKRNVSTGDLLRVFILGQKWMMEGLQEATFNALNSKRALDTGRLCSRWMIARTSSIRFLLVGKFVAALDKPV